MKEKADCPDCGLAITGHHKLNCTHNKYCEAAAKEPTPAISESDLQHVRRSFPTRSDEDSDEETLGSSLRDPRLAASEFGHAAICCTKRSCMCMDLTQSGSCFQGLKSPEVQTTPPEIRPEGSYFVRCQFEQWPYPEEAQDQLQAQSRGLLLRAPTQSSPSYPQARTSHGRATLATLAALALTPTPSQLALPSWPPPSPAAAIRTRARRKWASPRKNNVLIQNM